MKKTLIIILAVLSQAGAYAQQVLTLEECHQMALSGNEALEQARDKVQMATYDKKIARANYFPEISASGAYLYNSRNIKLMSDETAEKLNNMGTTVQSQLTGNVTELMKAVMTNPITYNEYKNSAMWQTVVGALQQTDVSAALNAVGNEVVKAFDIDMANVFAGVVSVQQPVFVGGKIIASNKMATLAEQLSKTQYDSQCQEVLLNVDQAYWQIVSLVNKEKLAKTYVALLEDMKKDAEVSVAEGVAVQSDLLAINVKLNEAKMLLCKASNGLELSRMLLCKQIGLPLDTDIKLADEGLENISTPALLSAKSMDSVVADRPETKSLELASQIYDQKVKIARADMMPSIALTANYMISNPSAFNGIENKFGGMFNAGVMVKVPIFHGTEALQKTRKAKAEADIYRSRYNEACKMVNLQVEQLTKQQDEAMEKLSMAESNLASAEENLRVATVGFEEGVVNADVTMQAQTAWVKAHSDLIDAQTELQMNHSSLLKAQGEYIGK